MAEVQQQSEQQVNHETPEIKAGVPEGQEPEQKTEQKEQKAKQLQAQKAAAPTTQEKQVEQGKGKQGEKSELATKAAILLTAVALGGPFGLAAAALLLLTLDKSKEEKDVGYSREQVQQAAQQAGIDPEKLKEAEQGAKKRDLEEQERIVVEEEKLYEAHRNTDDTVDPVAQEKADGSLVSGIIESTVGANALGEGAPAKQGSDIANGFPPEDKAALGQIMSGMQERGTKVGGTDAPVQGVAEDKGPDQLAK